VRGRVGVVEHAAELVVRGRHVGLGLGDGRVRGRGELGGGDGVLGVSVVPRAYGAGRTSWTVLCLGARICIIELWKRRESGGSEKSISDVRVEPDAPLDRL
jgi:hypothetical protein